MNLQALFILILHSSASKASTKKENKLDQPDVTSVMTTRK